MNTNPHPQDPLSAAEAALRELPQHVVPSADTLNRLAALAAQTESQAAPMLLASPANSRWRKLAAVLLTMAAVVAVSYGFLHTPQPAFAFEDVVTAVRKTSTVSYTTVVTPKNGPASQYKSYHQGTLTRMEYADGSYSVMDLPAHKMLMVQPAAKVATLTQLGKTSQDMPAMGDSIIAWLKAAEQTGKPVGEKTLAGLRVVGFEAAFGATTMTIWGDPQSKLPVQIESTIGTPSEPIAMVMRDFVFNAPLADSLFSLDVPAGYRLQEMKQPEVDFAALVKLPPEEHVVRILRFYAKLNSGEFPERIDGPELVSKLTSQAGAKRLEDPEFMKEFTPLAASMGATWTFRQTLNKFGYNGAAHLNDARTIVFWYLPKDAEKYRVVFADLTIGDASENELPKVPLK